MKIYEAVRALRLALHLERTEFAKLLNVSRGVIHNWETQQRSPKLSNRRKMFELAKENNVLLTQDDFFS